MFHSDGSRGEGMVRTSAKSWLKLLARLCGRADSPTAPAAASPALPNAFPLGSGEQKVGVWTEASSWLKQERADPERLWHCPRACDHGRCRQWSPSAEAPQILNRALDKISEDHLKETTKGSLFRAGHSKGVKYRPFHFARHSEAERGTGKFRSRRRAG